jgi:prepilin-type N-terminal cleavage/methylation domain-containing protein
MQDKKKGFTLVEVLIAVIVFAFGVLSMAAFASLNYMYLRVNQARAKVHLMTESTVEDVQNWVREPMANFPTVYDSLWDAAEIGVFTPPNDTMRKYQSAVNIRSAVIFDTIVGLTAASTDAKIYVHIISTGTSGDTQIKDSTYFCLANYKIGK